MSPLLVAVGCASVLALAACGSGNSTAAAPLPASVKSMSAMSSPSAGMSMSGSMSSMSMPSGSTGGMSGMSGMSGMNGPITGAPGSLVVVAPGTLANALPTLDMQFTQADGGSLTPNLGHSPAQVLQLQQGSPGDVFLTVGSQSMDQARKDGLLSGPVTVFARNRLAIIVQAGNPKHITSLADLARSGTTVVLPDQSTPVGMYAEEALKKAGVSVTPASTEEGSPEAAEQVATGNADASIVFTTDIRAAGSSVAQVPIPQADQVPAAYDAAVLASSSHQAMARAYVESLRSTMAQQALRKLGFLAP